MKKNYIPMNVQIVTVCDNDVLTASAFKAVEKFEGDIIYFDDLK